MIDHLVYASADLPSASARIAELLGATPTPGGSHVGHGTYNELLSLGGATYLEVIGPDPAQPAPDGRRPFGIDQLTAPALVAWCVRPVRPLDEVVAAARAVGVDFGEVASMSRRRPDGVLLEWELTFPQLDGPVRPSIAVHDRLGRVSAPDRHAAAGCTPARARHHPPEPGAPCDRRSTSSDPRIEWTVRGGERPVLRARIATPRGEVTLTS